MMLHHLVTIFVIVAAQINQQQVISVYILFLHDLSDVPLIVGRMCTDFKKEVKLFSYTVYAYHLV